MKSIYRLKKDFLCDPISSWHFKHHSRSLHTLWSTAPFEWSISQIGSRGEVICPGQGFYIKFIYGLNLCFKNMIQGHWIPYHRNMTFDIVCLSFTCLTEVWTACQSIVHAILRHLCIIIRFMKEYGNFFFKVNVPR